MRSATYSERSDEDLLALIIRDDGDAFSELYRRYWEMLLGIAYQRLQSLPMAEDAVHDVFAGLWRKRHGLTVDLPGPYLAAAVKYQTLLQIRKAEGLRKFGRRMSPAGEPPSAEDEFEIKQIERMIREEVLRLPERCRLVFQYSREEGLSHAEIAEKMQISVKTVENQMSKALRQLRGRLQRLLFFLLAAGLVVLPAGVLVVLSAAGLVVLPTFL